MSRQPPFDRRATYEDLAAVPDRFIAEIIDGELHTEPRPDAIVASTPTALGGMLLRAMAAGGADRWQILPTPELHLAHDILVPGVAGWRLSRLPELPRTPYFTVPPDWICEVPSSSSAALRARRMAIYAGEGVTHAWLIDPVAHALEVRRVTEDGRWTTVSTHVGEELVRAEPFQSVELSLGALWPRPVEPHRLRRRR